MSNGDSIGSTRILGGVWREEIRTRRGRLLDELSLRARDQSETDTSALRLDVAERLSRVEAVVERPLRRGEWWTGAAAEACWSDLRRAQLLLLALAPAHELPARGHDALARGTSVLGPSDERVLRLKALLDRGDAPASQLRAETAIVLEASYDASDRDHRDLRSFRNGLRVVSAILGVLAVVLAFAVWAFDWPLVPGPATLPHGWLVVVALFFGALGALFSAIPSLAQVPERASIFNPVREQAALKVAVGAWSAIVGLIAVSAGMTTSVDDVMRPGSTGSLAGFAMIAALFGAGQEALTRFADHKASDLRAGSTPTSS